MPLIGIAYHIKRDDSYSLRHEALISAVERFNPMGENVAGCFLLKDARSTDDVLAAVEGALDYRKDQGIVFETTLATFRHFGRPRH